MVVIIAFFILIDTYYRYHELHFQSKIIIHEITRYLVCQALLACQPNHLFLHDREAPGYLVHRVTQGNPVLLALQVCHPSRCFLESPFTRNTSFTNSWNDWTLYTFNYKVINMTSRCSNHFQPKLLDVFKPTYSIADQENPFFSLGMHFLKFLF